MKKSEIFLLTYWIKNKQSARDRQVNYVARVGLQLRNGFIDRRCGAEFPLPKISVSAIGSIIIIIIALLNANSVKGREANVFSEIKDDITSKLQQKVFPTFNTFELIENRFSTLTIKQFFEIYSTKTNSNIADKNAISLPRNSLHPSKSIFYEYNSLLDHNITNNVDDASFIQAMANSINEVGGGTLNLPSRKYTINSTIELSSNTHLKCSGAELIASRDHKIGPLVTNVSRQTQKSPDHDITIEGCSFQYQNSSIHNEGHAIEFVNVKHARISGNRFDGGGNATAILASDDILTEGNVATNIQNTCFDHWDGTRNFRVINNSCYLIEGVAGSFGVQATGLSTKLTDSPVAGGLISGNRIFEPGRRGACINLNSSATSSVTKVQISDNYCSIKNGENAASGIILSGRGGYHIIRGNVIEGSTDGPAIIQTSDENSDVIIAENILLHCSYRAPHRANIELNGFRNILSTNKFIKCDGVPFYVADESTLVVNNDSGSGDHSTSTNVSRTTGSESSFSSISSGNLSAINFSVNSIRASNGIANVNILSGGAYYSIPQINVSGPGGGGQQAEARVSAMGLSTAAVQDIQQKGSKYTIGCQLFPVGGIKSVSASLIVTSIDDDGGILGISPLTQGTYMQIPPMPQSFVPEGCFGKDFMMNLKWFIKSISISNTGSGYTSKAKLNADGGAGSGLKGYGIPLGGLSLGKSGQTGDRVVSLGAIIDGSGIRRNLDGEPYKIPGNTSLVRFTQKKAIDSQLIVLPDDPMDGQSIQFVNYYGRIAHLDFQPAVNGYGVGMIFAANSGIRLRWDSEAGFWQREQ